MFPPDKGSGSMHAFYMMSAKVTLLNITLHDTQCRGNTCDAIDTMNTRVCGCFQNSDNYAPVVMCLQLLITPPKDKGSTPQNFGEPFSCTAFTSKSFTRMCFKFPNMPSTVRSRHFSMRDGPEGRPAVSSPRRRAALWLFTSLKKSQKNPAFST